MTPALETKNSNGRSFIYLIAVIAGANAGFILSLLETLNFVECFVVMFALGALFGGAVFTFFEMRGLS
jgi:hypothetical protein